MRVAPVSLLLFLALPLSGCSDLASPPPGKTIPRTDTETPEVKPAEELVPHTDATIDPQPRELPETPADVIDPTTSSEAADTQRVAAEAGVGVKGQSLESGSMITQPARAFFSAKQRLAFIQVEQALQLYKASNDSLPQSTEEFMRKVIEPNNIQLPELPRGHRYVFDAETGDLMVEKPTN